VDEDKTQAEKYPRRDAASMYLQKTLFTFNERLFNAVSPRRYNSLVAHHLAGGAFSGRGAIPHRR
jgi:hypothetical protein